MFRATVLRRADFNNMEIYLTLQELQDRAECSLVCPQPPSYSVPAVTPQHQICAWAALVVDPRLSDDHFSFFCHIPSLAFSPFSVNTELLNHLTSALGTPIMLTTFLIVGHFFSQSDSVLGSGPASPLSLWIQA